ncbi:MAG: putative ABC transporter permease [Lachnospiraceae bacterium]
MFYYLLFIFFVYSFIGWIGEEIVAAFKHGKLINRGFANGPVCPKYGVAMALITVDTWDLTEYPLAQLAVIIIFVALFEYVSGILLHKLTGYRFWDYSKEKWNFRGYICVRSTLMLGAVAALMVWLLNPFLYLGFKAIPLTVSKIVLIVLAVLLFIDLFVTVASFLRWKMGSNVYENVADKLKETKNSISHRVFDIVRKRMYKAFPEFESQTKSEGDGFGRPENRVFAQGVCLDKLIWIFLISALVGDIIETIFVWATDGVLMSRSSVLYGPFSVVWGLGGALATALLYPLKEKNDRFVFGGGFLLGGVYEYTCSVFTEYVLGTVFWDYSHIPYNINGRINLLFCFFWGIAALFWVKVLYPLASKYIEKIPPVAGKVLTLIIVVAMTVNMVISAAAIGRYTQRKAGNEPSNILEEFLDENYTDSFIERVYPNMKITE